MSERDIRVEITHMNKIYKLIKYKIYYESLNNTKLYKNLPDNPHHDQVWTDIKRSLFRRTFPSQVLFLFRVTCHQFFYNTRNWIFDTIILEYQTQKQEG